jgi:hypothetical protein
VFHHRVGERRTADLLEDQDEIDLVEAQQTARSVSGPAALASRSRTASRKAKLVFAEAEAHGEPYFLGRPSRRSATMLRWISITMGMVRAFGPTVRVNCIMAGPFLTDISHA